MDSHRFDRLAQEVGCALSRRSIIAAASASLIGWCIAQTDLVSSTVLASRDPHNTRRKRRGSRDRRPGRARARSAKQGRGGAPIDQKILPGGTPTCALQPYDKNKPGSRFVGPRKMRNDVEFFDELAKVNDCAQQANVYLETGSTYRNAKENRRVNQKSSSSNHIAGHALDFKFLVPEPGTTFNFNNPGTYDRWDWINITDCTKTSSPGTDCSRGLGPLSAPESQYPEPIQDFIRCVRQTPGITWGGDHPTCCGGDFDPIHVDDRLNESNRNAYTEVEAYRKRVDAMVASGSCPPGTTCDPKTGTCVTPCDPPCTGGKVCLDGACQCDVGKTDCDGCTDTTKDDANCGACGNDCAAVGEKCCGGSCVDTQTDLDHCGECHEICAADGCCGGTCTDLQNDDHHCGDCETDCTTEPCQMCSEGTCGPCAAGFECCGGKCRSACPPGKFRSTSSCECVACGQTIGASCAESGCCDVGLCRDGVCVECRPVGPASSQVPCCSNTSLFGRCCLPEGAETDREFECCSGKAIGGKCCGWAAFDAVSSPCTETGCCQLKMKQGTSCAGGTCPTPICFEGMCYPCSPEGAPAATLRDCCSGQMTRLNSGICCSSGMAGASCARSGCCFSSSTVCRNGVCVAK